MDDWTEDCGDGAEPGLGSGERLLIAALRRAAAAGQGCAALTRRDFAAAFPGDVDEVFGTFRTFLQALAHAGRRKLRAGHPGSPVPTPDETLLVSLIGAAQAGDEDRFEAQLCWLARAEARALVAVTARALAMAFAAHGQWLRPPLCQAGPRASRRDLAR